MNTELRRNAKITFFNLMKNAVFVKLWEMREKTDISSQ